MTKILARRFDQGGVPAPLAKAKAAALALAIATAVAALPMRSTHAQTVQDYLAAGFRSVALTAVPGPFTGCRKGQSYTFDNGTIFTCTGKRSAFEVNPRVQLLTNAGGTDSVLFIAGVAYTGSIIEVKGGIRGHAIQTITDAPELPKPLGFGMAVGAVLPIVPTRGILALQDITELRNEAVQTYPARKSHRNPG